MYKYKKAPYQSIQGFTIIDYRYSFLFYIPIKRIWETYIFVIA